MQPADELFVPAARVSSLFDGPAVDSPLYRFPVFGYFALSIGAAALGNARGDDGRVRRASGAERPGRDRPHARAALGDTGGGRRGRVLAARRAGDVLPVDRGSLGGGPGEVARPRRAAQRPPPRGNARGPHLSRRRSFDVRPRRRNGDLRRLPASAPVPRRPHCHRSLPGQRGVPGASGTDPAGSGSRHRGATSGRVDGALPFWLDRPDEEAITIADEVQRAGFGTLWIGELATFDAFARLKVLRRGKAGIVVVCLQLIIREKHIQLKIK